MYLPLEKKFFPTNVILPFCQRRTKMIFSQKNTFKDEISGIIEKDNIHPGKYSISSDRKIKDDKKFYFYKNVPMILCTFMETFLGVFINCFQMKKKTSKLNVQVIWLERFRGVFECQLRKYVVH